MFVRNVLRLLGVVVTVAATALDWASVSATSLVLEPDLNSDLYGLKDLLPSADVLEHASKTHLENVPCKAVVEEKPIEVEEPVVVLPKPDGPSESSQNSSQEEAPNVFRKIQYFLHNMVNDARKEPKKVLRAANAVRAMSSCGNDRKFVALTFDDGPDAIYGDSIRKELDRLGVQATFFLTPESRGYDQDVLCEQARLLAADGHELQLHTMTHPHLPKLNAAEFDWQVQGGIDWMKKCGLPRPNMLRPPYGELKPDQARYLNDKYELIIAQWNVETSDFEESPTDDDIFRITQERFEQHVGLGNSAVILMHDFDAGRRPGIITRVVEYFREQGYSFVTMNSCYNACNGPVCKGNGGPAPYEDVYIP